MVNGDGKVSRWAQQERLLKHKSKHLMQWFLIPYHHRHQWLPWFPSAWQVLNVSFISLSWTESLILSLFVFFISLSLLVLCKKWWSSSNQRTPLLKICLKCNNQVFISCFFNIFCGVKKVLIFLSGTSTEQCLWSKSYVIEYLIVATYSIDGIKLSDHIPLVGSLYWIVQDICPWTFLEHRTVMLSFVIIDLPPVRWAVKLLSRAVSTHQSAICACMWQNKTRSTCKWCLTSGGWQ